MPAPKQSSETATVRHRFRFVVGGEAYGKPHEPGDLVPDNVPQAKLDEWAKAKVIRKDKP